MSNNICIVCGAKDKWKKLTRLPAIIFGASAEIHRCTDCGCARTLPAPTTDQEYYEDNVRYNDLFTNKYESYNASANELLSELDGVLEFNGKKLLDIASGGGYLVEAASKKGFLAVGIESNQQMVAWCRKNGINISQGDAFEFLKSSNEKYDVIVLSAIIEHIEDPQHLIKACGDALKPEGMLLISQAIYNGLLPRLFPWGWYGWQPKEHFWHFTAASLDKFFIRLGYEIIKSNRYSLIHPWVFRGGLKEIVGRNVAALLARISHYVGMEDGYNIILKRIS